MLRKLAFLKPCDTQMFEIVATDKEMEKEIFNCGQFQRCISKR